MLVGRFLGVTANADSPSFLFSKLAITDMQNECCAVLQVYTIHQDEASHELIGSAHLLSGGVYYRFTLCHKCFAF